MIERISRVLKQASSIHESWCLTGLALCRGAISVVSQVADLVDRPICEHRPPDHILQGQRSPNVGVKAVVAVVPHHKDVPWGYPQLLESVLGLLIDVPLTLRLPIDEELPLLHLHRHHVVEYAAVPQFPRHHSHIVHLCRI